MSTSFTHARSSRNAPSSQSNPMAKNKTIEPSEKAKTSLKKPAKEKPELGTGPKKKAASKKTMASAQQKSSMAYLVMVPNPFNSTGMLREVRTETRPEIYHVFWIKVGDSGDNIENRTDLYPTHNPESCTALIQLDHKGNASPGKSIEEKVLKPLRKGSHRSEWYALYLPDLGVQEMLPKLWRMFKQFDILYDGWDMTTEAREYLESDQDRPQSDPWTLEEAMSIIRIGIRPSLTREPRDGLHVPPAYPMISVIVTPRLDEGGFGLIDEETKLYRSHIVTPPTPRVFRITRSTIRRPFKALAMAPQGYKEVAASRYPGGWIKIEVEDLKTSPTLRWLREYVDQFHITKGILPPLPKYDGYAIFEGTKERF
ncbi:hypothetical protein OPQ81_008479 [Rhizoctonia solani]|nr:hypothetical protein OPQ81_008479 [Rhizoctonia solani]